MYYLAQSYRDAGRFAEAAETYAARVSMEGWEEETWNAQLQEARCRLGAGDDFGFLSAVMKAYERRPHRAESLYELAKFYRQRGAHETAMHFCETASGLPLPAQDSLFIEDFIYETGIREEISISGYYSKLPTRQKAGRSMCFELALDRDVPEASRSLARHNQVFYARPGVELFPSLKSWPLAFEAPLGGNVTNPSIAVWNGATYVIVRNVNYEINSEGRYTIPGNGTIETRNYLLRLDFRIATTPRPAAKLYAFEYACPVIPAGERIRRSTVVHLAGFVLVLCDGPRTQFGWTLRNGPWPHRFSF